MFPNFILGSGLICFLVASVFWVLRTSRIKNSPVIFSSSSVVPITLLVVTGALFLLSPYASARILFVSGLTLIWGVRLWLHLYIRSASLYETQALAYVSAGLRAFFLSLPVIFVSAYGVQDLGLVGYLALGVWLTGFILEVVGDSALDRFRSDLNDKEKLFTGGLSRYVRYPNYTGEILMWVALAMLALPVAPLGFLAFLSPAYLLVYLLWFRIPEIEARLARFPEFVSYSQATPKLFPDILKRA